MLATVPLIGGVTGGVAGRACPGYWSGLPPCSAVVAALSGAGSVLPQLEWKPQIRFWALRGGRWDWSPRTGRRARAVPRVSALCCVTWHLLCHRTKYTVASTALGPVSTLGMPAAALGSQSIVSTGAPVQINQSQVPGPHPSLIWARRELQRQRRPWPSPVPRAHAHKAPDRWGHPVPALGTPSVHSDALQALNLHSQWQRCKVVACTTTGLDFSPTSQVSWLLRFSHGFSPTSVSGQPAGI